MNEKVDNSWELKAPTEGMGGKLCAEAIVNSEGEKVVCGGECQWTGILIFNSKSDANLTLAAPLLLELLEEITDLMEWYGGGENDRDEFYCPWCQAHSDDSSKIPHETHCGFAKARILIAEARKDE